MVTQDLIIFSQGIGIYVGVRLSEAIDGIIGVAKTTAQIALKQLLLAKLIKDTMTAAALKTLVASAVLQLTTVANRLNPIINLWDLVSIHSLYFPRPLTTLPSGPRRCA